MRPFTVVFTGDFRDVDGRPIGDLATDLRDPHPWVRYRFLADLGLTPGDDGYTDRLYHLEITAVHVRSHNAIIVCRPWLRASAFAGGAADLVAIGRAGIGVDKLDLDACTAHDVGAFNAPHGLVHSTSSAALLFMPELPCAPPRSKQSRCSLVARAWSIMVVLTTLEASIA